MRALPVALQVYSVRDYAEKDMAGTLRQIKAMGYDGVELAGLYGITPENLRKLLDEIGLPAVSAHVSIHEMESDPAGTVACYHLLGCRYIAIPSLPPDRRPGAKDFQKTLDLIKTIGQLCNEKGMTLLYHNHDFEFNKMPDGSFGLDHLYDSVPASLLQTQLDTCWVRVAGQSPVAYINRYAGRCPVVHLKDYVKEGDVARMYDLIGEKGEDGKENAQQSENAQKSENAQQSENAQKNENAQQSENAQKSEKDGKEMPREAKAAGSFEFRPVGYGVQDFPSILAAATEAGAQWVVVEQDSSVGRTSLEAAALSRDYLKSLGWYTDMH